MDVCLNIQKTGIITNGILNCTVKLAMVAHQTYTQPNFKINFRANIASFMAQTYNIFFSMLFVINPKN